MFFSLLAVMTSWLAKDRHNGWLWAGAGALLVLGVFAKQIPTVFFLPAVMLAVASFILRASLAPRSLSRAVGIACDGDRHVSAVVVGRGSWVDVEASRAHSVCRRRGETGWPRSTFHGCNCSNGEAAALHLLGHVRLLRNGPGRAMGGASPPATHAEMACSWRPSPFSVLELHGYDDQSVPARHGPHSAGRRGLFDRAASHDFKECVVFSKRSPIRLGHIGRGRSRERCIPFPQKRKPNAHGPRHAAGRARPHDVARFCRRCARATKPRVHCMGEWRLLGPPRVVCGPVSLSRAQQKPVHFARGRDDCGPGSSGNHPRLHFCGITQVLSG